MLFEAIVITLLCCLLTIEWMNGHFGFSRPLIAGTLTGLVLGDVVAGVTIGASLQLIFMGVSAIGAAVPPDQTIASVVATSLAILTGSGVDVAFSLAVPVAVAAQALDIFGRTINTFLLHVAESNVEKGNYSGIIFAHHMGFVVQAVRTAVIVFPAIFFGVEAVEAFFAIIPDFVLTGLEVSGMILPAVGFGMLLTMLDIPYLLPFFFIGFLLAIFAGFSTIGVAVLAIAIAFLYDYQKKGNREKENQGETDLDSLMEE